MNQTALVLIRSGRAGVALDTACAQSRPQKLSEGP